MDRIYKSVTVLLAVLLLLASCNKSTAPSEEESEYKKENDEYITKLESNPEYTPLIFQNEKYPIYYKVLESGDHKEDNYPLQNSRVLINIYGERINGEVFQPTQDMVTYIFHPSEGGVVKGLQYALQSMYVGDKWEVVIPHELGYGRFQRSKELPPYSTLIFVVELKQIIKR